jgi:hypothetical protein
VKLNGARIPVVADAVLVMAGACSIVTTLDGCDGCDVPAALVAVTVNAYESPLVRPVTVSGLADPVTVCPPLAGVVASEAVTV